MAEVSIEITSRVAAIGIGGGATDSSGGIIRSRHCVGRLEPASTGGIGIHVDSFKHSFPCADPSSAVGDCEFDTNPAHQPLSGNRIQIISRNFLFIDNTTIKWYLSGGTGEYSRWGISLGVGYLNVTWNVVGVGRPP